MISGPKMPAIGGLSLGSRLSDWGYAAGWLTVRAMPEFAARTMFGAGALYASRGGGPDQLRRNLARVIGAEPQDVPADLVRAALASYARYWREAFRLPAMDQRQIGRAMNDTAAGREHLEAALAAGRGVVMALPHSGNWDLAGVWLTQNYGRFTTVAERLKPESLYRRFIDYRESLGFEVIPLSGGQQPPYALLSERLGENRVVCLMAERDLSRTGVEVEFFGEPTRMPAGPAKLAISTGAALLPVHSWYDGDTCRVDIEPALDCGSGDVAAVTQALAHVFARNIAEHPADWHMLQPQWLTDLSDERQARMGVGEEQAQRPQERGPA